MDFVDETEDNETPNIDNLLPRSLKNIIYSMLNQKIDDRPSLKMVINDLVELMRVKTNFPDNPISSSVDAFQNLNIDRFLANQFKDH